MANFYMNNVTLMYATAAILSIIWVISLQQLCVTSMHDKGRIKITFLCLIFVTISFISITLVYLTTLYPNFKIFTMHLATISDILEAIWAMTGFHIFRLFHLFMARNLYSSINRTVPPIFKYTFMVMESIIFIMVPICYSFVYVFNERHMAVPLWKMIFYIILGVIITIISIFSWYVFKHVINILKMSHSAENKNRMEIKSALLYMQIGLVWETIIGLFSVANLFMSFEIIYNFLGVNFNHELYVNIVHTFIGISLSTALLLRIYKSTKGGDECCTLSESSVYVHYGCGWFWYQCCCECCCYDDDDFGSTMNDTNGILMEGNNIKHNKNKNAVLSTTIKTHTTIDENNITPIDPSIQTASTVTVTTLDYQLI
eukprot:490813_1